MPRHIPLLGPVILLTPSGERMKVPAPEPDKENPDRKRPKPEELADEPPKSFFDYSLNWLCNDPSLNATAKLRWMTNNYLSAIADAEKAHADFIAPVDEEYWSLLVKAIDSMGPAFGNPFIGRQFVPYETAIREASDKRPEAKAG